MNEPLTVGVDIGGTKVLAGVVNGSGTVVARVRRETPQRSQAPAVVEDVIVAAIEALRAEHEIVAVGVGAAGFVDLEGTVRFAPHLSWRDEPLGQMLERRLQVPVVVDNDANMAARAEMRLGAGRGYRHALCITLGTGIGGALVLDGNVVRGSQGMAGEFGHMQVVSAGLACECGQLGCWEQYCSGKALLRAALAESGQASLTGAEVTQAAVDGLPWARLAYDEVGAWLGVGLAGLVAAFDPEVVIVGGGLADAGDTLLNPARAAFGERLPGKGFRSAPQILPAQLGSDAGFIGAADLALRLAADSGRWRESQP